MIVSVSRTVYSVTVMQWCGAGRRGGEELCGISMKSHVQTPLSFVITLPYNTCSGTVELITYWSEELCSVQC